MMGTYSYAVSRFVPNPIRNEAVNIGVIVVDAETGRTAHKFRHNLRALKPRCPGADIESLEKMVGSFHVGDMPGGASDLKRLAHGHTNLLQFTPPRAVVAPSLEDSLRRAFETYIGEDAAQSEPARSKGPRALLLGRIDAALAGACIAGDMVVKRPALPGRRGRFMPDRCVPGDGWSLALHAISFAAGAKSKIKSPLTVAKVLAVDFEDARAKNDGLECTAVVEPPPDGANDGIESYKQALGRLKDWHCTVIQRSGVRSCARKLGQRLGLLDGAGRPALRNAEPRSRAGGN